MKINHSANAIIVAETDSILASLAAMEAKVRALRSLALKSKGDDQLASVACHIARALTNESHWLTAMLA